MQNQKSTKRAFCSSVVAVVICVAMLIGTTFAWFTSTASTAVNKIESGKLAVSLEVKKPDGSWENAEGKTLNFEKAKEASANEAVLWEPGCTYNLPELRVVNKENLALKYKMVISGATGDVELLDAIEFTAEVDGAKQSVSNGDSIVNDNILLPGSGSNSYNTVKISGHMKEEAGNPYQGKTVSGIAVTVYATQATVEFDSNNNQYDAEAEFVYTATESELQAALMAGKNVVLKNNITLSSELRITKNAEIYGNGYTISGYPLNVNNASVTVKNLNFNAPTNAKNNASNFYAKNVTGKILLENCSFEGTQWDCVQILPEPGAEIVIQNCSFRLSTAAPSSNKTRFVHVEAKQNSNADVKIAFKNNFFGPTDYINEALIDIDYINLNGIDFGGNNTYTDTKADIYVCGANWKRSITKAEAYQKLGNILAPTQEKLGDLIEAGEKNLNLAAGEYTLYNVNTKKTTSTTLTLTGKGAKETTFKIGKPVPDQAGEYNADYSFENSDVTFKNMTVNMGTGDYKGIVRAKSLCFENCTLVGRGSYWGSNKAVFKNCTFINNNDYCITTYAGTDFVFENCGFYSNIGKYVNAYKEQKADTALTFTGCSFNYTGSTTPEKPAVCLKSYADMIWTVQFNNCTANAKTDAGTNSNLYSIESGMNKATTVTVNGAVAWANGAKQ